MSGRILVTPRSLTTAGADTRALEPLERAGFEIVMGPAGRLPDPDEQRELLRGCVGYLAGVEEVTAETLAAAIDLRVIARNGAGVDGIDLDAAERYGVAIERVPGANAPAVAELAVTLILASLRSVFSAHLSVQTGGWDRPRGRELCEVVIGVVGLGAVGSRVASSLSALGARVVAFDPIIATAAPAKHVDLETLARVADVITLHCPPDPSGPLVDRAFMSTAGQLDVLVNTARSSLVDDAVILEALESGSLCSYAVDVYPQEPPELTALLRHPNVLTTPHIGGFTGPSIIRATKEAVDALLRNLGASGTQEHPGYQADSESRHKGRQGAT